MGRGNSCKILAVGVLLLTLLFLSGCSGSAVNSYIDFDKPAELPVQEEGVHKQKALLIGLATVQSPQQTINSYRDVADYLSRKLECPVVLVQRRTYEEINILLSNGEIDMAFSSTGAYSSYRGLSDIEVLAMVNYQGSIFYQAEIIVPQDSRVQRFADLRGKTFAFTDPLSYSGHVLVAHLLNQENTVPERYFKRYYYTYSHDKSIWAVANHLADAAGVDSQVLDATRAQSPELAEKVRVIATFPPTPSGPVVVTKALPEVTKDCLRKLFLHMHEDPALTQPLKNLLIDRFVPPQPELYQPLKRIYDHHTGLEA